MVITPRDHRGTPLGPGRVEAFTVAPGDGVTLTGSPRDLTDGRYAVPIAWIPGRGDPPAVLVRQPDRNPVVIKPRGGPGMAW
jgi:hypothetical protein